MKWFRRRSKSKRRAQAAKAAAAASSIAKQNVSVVTEKGPFGVHAGSATVASPGWLTKYFDNFVQNKGTAIGLSPVRIVPDDTTPVRLAVGTVDDLISQLKTAVRGASSKVFASANADGLGLLTATNNQRAYGYRVKVADSLLNWRNGKINLKAEFTFGSTVKTYNFTLDATGRKPCPWYDVVLLAVDSNAGIGQITEASKLVITSDAALGDAVNPLTTNLVVESLNNRDLGW